MHFRLATEHYIFFFFFPKFNMPTALPCHVLFSLFRHHQPPLPIMFTLFTIWTAFTPPSPPPLCSIWDFLLIWLFERIFHSVSFVSTYFSPTFPIASFWNASVWYVITVQLTRLRQGAFDVEFVVWYMASSFTFIFTRLTNSASFEPAHVANAHQLGFLSSFKSLGLFIFKKIQLGLLFSRLPLTRRTTTKK